MQPWWFLVAFIPLIGFFVYRSGFMLKRLRDKVERGEKDWNDDWDPFS